MKPNLVSVFACLAFLLYLSRADAQVASKPVPLNDVLTEQAKNHHWIVLAVLGDPMPLVKSDLRNDTNLEKFANDLAVALPAYAVHTHAQNVVTLKATGVDDPFQVVLPQYSLPSNLADLKLTLLNALAYARSVHTTEGAGGLVTGLSEPPELAPKLHPLLLKKKTGDEVLIATGEQLGGLASIFMIEKARLDKGETINVPHWDLLGGATLERYPQALSKEEMEQRRLIMPPEPPVKPVPPPR